MKPFLRTTGPRESATRGSVVFVHGFPFDGSMWSAQLAGLPVGWRGIAPDLRGLGRSPMDGDGCVPSGKRGGAGIARRDEGVLTMACHAGDLARLIEEEVGGPAIVCGLSMGGYVTFELVRSHPELLGGLVLADTRPEADTDEGRENRVATAQAVRRSGTRPLATAMIPKLLAPYTVDEAPEVVEAVRRMILEAPAATVVAALAGMARRPDSTRDLPGIRVPTLVVAGEDDTLTPPETARAMAAAIPGAEVSILPGAGHLSPMEQPEAFNQVLSGFLEKVNGS